jgi:hypothetical protein
LKETAKRREKRQKQWGGVVGKRKEKKLRELFIIGPDF